MGSGSSAAEGIELDGGSYAATVEADTFIVDVSFDGTSIVSLDNDSIITGFDPENDTILLRGTGAPSSFDVTALTGSTGVEVFNPLLIIILLFIFHQIALMQVLQ